MLYLVLCCGIFLLAVVPYLIVQLKKAGQPSLSYSTTEESWSAFL